MVLRTQKLGEADRIIWLLTSEHGQIRAVAKGVRRTTSKFGARLEPFSVVDIQLHRGRSLDTIIQVETIASHGELLAADYELYSRASVIVETADKLRAMEMMEPTSSIFCWSELSMRFLIAGTTRL